MVGFRGGRAALAASHTAEQGRAQTGRTLFREAAIKIDSKTYPVMDINELGFVIEHFDGDLVPRQRVYFELIIKLGEREQGFHVDALVVRTQNKTLVCRFHDLRRDALHAIQLLVASKAQRVLPGQAIPARR